MKEASGTFDFSSAEALLASPESILAFVMEDDPAIYVREEAIGRLAKRMKAKIDGDALVFNEAGRRVRRGVNLLQPPPLEDRWTPRVLIAKWHFTAGLICRRYSAGDWLQLFDEKRRPLYWYQIREDSNWCVFDDEGECAITLATIEGDFWYGSPGEGEPKRETHRLAKCWR